MRGIGLKPPSERRPSCPDWEFRRVKAASGYYHTAPTAYVPPVARPRIPVLCVVRQTAGCSR
jgi:hypothetical protein